MVTSNKYGYVYTIIGDKHGTWSIKSSITERTVVQTITMRLQPAGYFIFSKCLGIILAFNKIVDWIITS